MSYDKYITFNPDMMGCGRFLAPWMMAEALARGLGELREHHVESEAGLDAVIKAVSGADKVLHFKHTRDNEEKYVFDKGDILVYISHYAAYDYLVQIACRTAEYADSMLKRVSDALPKIHHTDPNVVPVNFWALTRAGVTSRTRKIAAPAWDTITGNYTAGARNGLATVMGLTPPLDGGKLLLWHGEPGTGKSYGIRALMREWRTWCRAHYIVDPERFFGEADYMLSVILDQTEDDADECEPVGVSSDPKVPIEAEHPWHLLVMEDSDEFLQADAKDRQGQSLSRLLNMADGLIGQGLNLLVLITTNEPLGKIHPAIQREGRCMANIEFGRLKDSELSKWADVHGLSGMEFPPEGKLLSDLYAKVRAQAQVKTAVEKRKLGLVR